MLEYGGLPLGGTYMPVDPTTGATELNLMLEGPYSTAMVWREVRAWVLRIGALWAQSQDNRTFVALITAALDALYQVSLGRGLTPAVDATCMNDPGLLVLVKYGSKTLVDR